MKEKTARNLEIWDAYENGATQRELAEKWGITRRSVGGVLEKYRMPRAPRDPRRAKGGQAK